MKLFRTCLLPLVVIAPALGGCTGDAPATADAETDAPVAVAPHELTIRSRDYQYLDVPESVPAGLTNIRLVNEGPDLHHAQLVRLDGGRTLKDVMDAVAAGGPPPAWAVDVGGPNSPGTPGGETSALVDLTPGNYALICFIPGPDGIPHVAKGMVQPLTVVASEGPAPTLPPADIVMTLNDYTFTTSAPITPGTHTIRVENGAAQPHEVLVVKLNEGATAEEMLAFMDTREGTPPGTIVGGTTAIANGGMNQVTLTFEMGDYALLCFIPDAGDGRPHVMHGMVQQIHVM